MKQYRIIIYLALVFTMASCSITGRLNRKGYTAGVEHSTKIQRDRIEEQMREEQSQRGYIEYTRADNSTVFLIPATTDENGETMMSLEIEQVTVVATSRSLPERLGKVNIDFVVTLPKELQGNCQSVEVIPVLHRIDGAQELEPISIRGGLFSKVQERNYWQLDRYKERYNPDEYGENGRRTGLSITRIRRM